MPPDHYRRNRDPEHGYQAVSGECLRAGYDPIRHLDSLRFGVRLRFSGRYYQLFTREAMIAGACGLPDPRVISLAGQSPRSVFAATGSRRRMGGSWQPSEPINSSCFYVAARTCVLSRPGRHSVRTINGPLRHRRVVWMLFGSRETGQTQ